MSTALEFQALSSLTWTTADGRKLQWKEMADSHLLNAANLIERRHAEQLSSVSTVMQHTHGEMASDAVSSELERLGIIGEEIASAATAMRRLVELRRQIETEFQVEKSRRLRALKIGCS